MKNIIRSAAAAMALSLAPFIVSAAEPGYVEIGRFKAAEGCQFVEVNLGRPLLKFAAQFVAQEDEQAAALIRGLKQVRVNVVGYDEESRADTTSRITAFRTELAAQGWEQIVAARQPGAADDVAIFVKLGDDETIEGLVVTVLDAGKREAVFVNVVGAIKAEQLSALGQRLHLEPLADLKLRAQDKDA